MMKQTKMEEMLEAVNAAFRGVKAEIYGDVEEGEELFLDGGKDLDTMFVYSILVNDAGEYELTVSGENGNDYYGTGDTYSAVETRKYKTVKGVINFIKKWDRENAY